MAIAIGAVRFWYIRTLRYRPLADATSIRRLSKSEKNILPATQSTARHPGI